MTDSALPFAPDTLFDPHTLFKLHTAERVLQGHLTASQAGQSIAQTCQENASSAEKFVRIYGDLRQGRAYTIHMSLRHTQQMLEFIAVHHHDQGLALALQAMGAHLAHMHQHGKPQHQLHTLHAQFAARLAKPTPTAAPQAVPVYAEQLASDFAQRVRKARQDSAQARQQRLALAPALLPTETVLVTIRPRNPDVVAERLAQAKGHCDQCQQPAPFSRKDGTPYLEVHHVQPLAEGGSDTLENTVALCPTCHRYAHFGLRGTLHIHAFQSNDA